MLVEPTAKATRARDEAKARAARSQQRGAVAAQILAAGRLRRGGEPSRKSAWGTGELVTGTYDAHLRVESPGRGVEAVGETSPSSRWLDHGSHYGGRGRKKMEEEPASAGDGRPERCPVCKRPIEYVENGEGVRVPMPAYCEQCGEYLVVREFVTV